MCYLFECVTYDADIGTFWGIREILPCNPQFRQFFLGIRVSLLSRQAIPFDGFCSVFRDTVTSCVAEAEIMLRNSIPLQSRATVAFDCFCTVLWHTEPKKIAVTEIILRRRIPLLGRLAIPFEGFCSTLRDTVSF